MTNSISSNQPQTASLTNTHVYTTYIYKYMLRYTSTCTTVSSSLNAVVLYSMFIRQFINPNLCTTMFILNHISATFRRVSVSAGTVFRGPRPTVNCSQPIKWLYELADRSLQGGIFLKHRCTSLNITNVPSVKCKATETVKFETTVVQHFEQRWGSYVLQVCSKAVRSWDT
jgi:hypothetical protein